ncbi:CorA family divalent cation transporter [Paenibacillus sp. NEAU-GSW1]|uniref:CorA family divalent cation transporter n=1 Tax=Paenibacillus sp. NEAU-GSW1 TaxID=2682486 RepID=UPI001C129900|nr:CorA family divalent cation transporter [Paenibacillus sp. NEAU-GSW1]
MTYLIVPFAFTEQLGKTIQNVEATALYEAVAQERREYFFDHINNLVGAVNEENKAIGQRFDLKAPASRRKTGLPTANTVLELKVKGETVIKLFLQDISLYLFESQVGFLTIKICTLTSETMNKVIRGNYYLKKLVQRDISLSFKTGPAPEDTKELSLGGWAEQILAPLQPKTFFEGEGKRASKALVFSTVWPDEAISESQREQSLFYLKHSFKDSYLRKEESPQASLSLFQNSHWGVALEGMANIVEKSEDPGTEAFFTGNYKKNIEKWYLYMYILALHQRYGLLNLSIRVAELSREYDEFMKQPLEQINNVTNFHSQLIAFKLRSTFTQVSNVSHQDRLYGVMREALKIDDLIQELHFEMDMLTNMIEIAATRERLAREEIDKRRSERFQTVVAIVSIALLPLSLLTGFFGMNFYFVSQFTGRHLIYATIGAYAIAAAGYFIYQKRRK